MSTQGILLLDLIGFALTILIIDLVRTRRLHVAYAVIWLAATVIMMIIITVPPLLDFITVAVGATFPASALTMLAFVLVFCMLILFSVQLSTLATRQIELVQAIALDELLAREDDIGRNDHTQ
jgi:hypothetical protein